MTERQEKMSQLLLELAGRYINRESNRNALITPTRIDISRDFKNCTIFVSVLPSEEDENVIWFLKRHAKDFRSFVKNNTNMRVLPFFEFEIDYGERNRQRLDEIGREI